MKTILVVLILLPFAAFAGAANTEINCVSKDGKVVVSGHVPGDTLEHRLELKTQDRTIVFIAETLQTPPYDDITNSTMSVVEDLRHGVFTIRTEISSAANMSLYAIPKTVKYRKIPYGFEASFAGKIKAAILRPTKDYYDHVKEDVTCKVKYQI